MTSSKGIIAIVLICVAAIFASFLYFFAWTSTMSEETAMKLALPKEEAVDSTAHIPGASHLLLVDNKRLFIYEDKDIQKGRWTDYSEIRDYLFKRRRADSEILVLIKPFHAASYKTTVDILDEMTIAEIERFAMVEPSEKELSFIREKN